MREIKFRGYSKEKKKWLYGSLMDFNDEGKSICIRKDTLLEKENGVTSTLISYESGFVEEASVGQYTGFKDKNGVEIYEGDIIKWWNEKCIVEFSAGKWLARKMTSNRVILLFDELSYIEVIGNIYEEKLKEDK